MSQNQQYENMCSNQRKVVSSCLCKIGTCIETCVSIYMCARFHEESYYTDLPTFLIDNHLQIVLVAKGFNPPQLERLAATLKLRACTSDIRRVIR